jgi:hypothetical protein
MTLRAGFVPAFISTNSATQPVTLIARQSEHMRDMRSCVPLYHHMRTRTQNFARIYRRRGCDRRGGRPLYAVHISASCAVFLLFVHQPISYFEWRPRALELLNLLAVASFTHGINLRQSYTPSSRYPLLLNLGGGCW